MPFGFTWTEVNRHGSPGAAATTGTGTGVNSGCITISPPSTDSPTSARCPSTVKRDAAVDQLDPFHDQPRRTERRPDELDRVGRSDVGDRGHIVRRPGHRDLADADHAAVGEADVDVLEPAFEGWERRGR